MELKLLFLTMGAYFGIGFMLSVALMTVVSEAVAKSLRWLVSRFRQ